jgi:UDP-N-acetylglucosamine 2-epimerase (non-hydrolysing)
MKRVLVCVGTRPNLIKITQLEKWFRSYPHLEYKLLHTGQHHDAKMNDIFFHELGLRPPDMSLKIGPGSQLDVISRIMTSFEALVVDQRPDMVLVPGDVNSSFACAFVASRHGIPVAHIESGLRSFDRAMPEEINRILIDAVSELFFVTEPSGSQNLLREGRHPGAIRYVGNSMIDALVAYMPLIERSRVKEQIGTNDYYLATFHRPVNVDEPRQLRVVADILTEIAKRRTVVFPIHPRTRKRFREFGLENAITGRNVRVTDPLGYIDFISLAKNARAVLTDSGGVQEETTFLGVPCVTLRESTERPITVDEGTNTLCALDLSPIQQILDSIESGSYKKGTIPALWDGRTSERIVKEVNNFLTGD